ncbi:MAG: UDP-N-acetylmuramoyl-tripeptide--D-alanyl-D-alanine ligase [Lachnospiraceae bacterium]|jgi:UDP-N-acetylmuramoyl-tripeptide--D-alanyl-D-alanine ligase|nr:UDP-N-acetylmuramoyl-tripeptide--D-alanyl-D-alanine ligase [Lachnospiraceae bacterium]
MNPYVAILYALVVVVASTLSTVRGLHIFQLNSYKAATHLRWLLAHASRLWTQALLLLCLVALVFFCPLFLQVLLLVAVGLLCFYNAPAKDAKKPLVFTGRVKRMIAAFALLTACILVFSAFAPPRIRPLVIGLAYVISPFMPIVANLINTPIEASIRGYYIRDAKKMLKACPDLLVIGITGSYGKTSVKYFLATLLKSRYNVLMTPESYNTPMGVVKTIRENLRSTHEIFICEMGARRPGDIKELCDIVNPRHGVITSIGPAHLETMGSIDAITKTKFELARHIDGHGTIFLNGDDAHIRGAMPQQDHRTYGLGHDNDCHAYDIRISPDGTVFSLNLRGRELAGLQTQLIGEHNVTNLAGAVAVSAFLGVSDQEIRAQLRKITAPPHRLQLLRNAGTVIIDDAYNSNPKGCEAALKTLSLIEGYRILITPGMVELGASQYDCNHAFGMQAAGVCDFVILVGGKQTKPILDGLHDAGFDDARIHVADHLREALARAHGIDPGKQKVILLENDLPDNY